MTWATCVNVDHKNDTALVKTKHNTFPVHLHKDIKNLISKGYRLKIVKSQVSKQWIAIDYGTGWGKV